MTRPKASRFTVTGFGPELMAALLKGSRERVTIPCPDDRTMMHIQMRLNMLRGAMYREHHEHYPLVMRARIMRTWKDPKHKDRDCALIIQPNDIQFQKIFNEAGITVPEPQTDILEGLEAPLAPQEPTPTNPYEKWKKLI